MVPGEGVRVGSGAGGRGNCVTLSLTHQSAGALRSRAVARRSEPVRTGALPWRTLPRLCHVPTSLPTAEAPRHRGGSHRLAGRDPSPGRIAWGPYSPLTAGASRATSPDAAHTDTLGRVCGTGTRVLGSQRFLTSMFVTHVPYPSQTDHSSSDSWVVCQSSGVFRPESPRTTETNAGEPVVPPSGWQCRGRGCA